MAAKSWMIDTRGRVYMVWAVLATSGFLATHFYQQRSINAVWLVISVTGLGYMYRVMPRGVRQTRNIFLAWLVPIAIGMAVSAAVFSFRLAIAGNLLAHLGAFWLAVMAVGYALNGWADSAPRTWYWFAALLNLVAAIACAFLPPFTEAQYLVAAIVTAWSMVNLLLFRSSFA
jgi:hypothetical protein